MTPTPSPTGPAKLPVGERATTTSPTPSSLRVSPEGPLSGDLPGSKFRSEADDDAPVGPPQIDLFDRLRS